MRSATAPPPRRRRPWAAALALAALAPAAAARQDAPVWRDQRAVNAAIDRGVEHLLARQARDGSWGPTPLRDEPHFDQRNGQTALSVYTLLKSQVPRDHPAIQRGVAFLLQGTPRTTYAIACQLLALGVLGDPAHLERAEELVERLVEFQRGDVLVWGYPEHGSVHFDLSNTQYAVLGLRAAQELGADVPRRALERCIEGVLAFQETPRSVAASAPAGATTTGAREVAGFSYDPWDEGAGVGTRGHPVTGSMTAAGVSILCLCDQGLEGDLGRRVRQRVDRAVALGTAWLEEHFAVDHNPGGPASWHYYYLYGLERVGSLRGLERIGAHDWYWEGARQLIGLQGEGGGWRRPGSSAWPPEPLGAANTCFALLFLVRATAPSSGPGASEGLHALEGAPHEVWLRGAGRGRLSVWVSGFSEAARARFPEGLLVREVVWRVDGAEVARVAGDPTRPWRDERFAIQHRFARAGRHTVSAEVRVDASLAAAAGEPVLRSGELVVEASDVLEDWMLSYAEESTASIWRDGRLTLEASSQRDEHGPGRVVDGLQFTCWLPAPDDAAPTLRFRLSKPLRATRLAFSQAGGSALERAGLGRVTRVGLRCNGARELLEVALDPDPRRKTWVELPRSARRLRELEVVLLAHEGAGAFGLAEVELLSR